MGEIYESEETGDDENEDFEETTTRRTSKKDDTDKPVLNAGEIPLFVNADKRGLNTAEYLKVTKLDKPGRGYKGSMPLTSTLETISGLHGNGTYNIQLCNANHKVLRTLENQIISLSDEERQDVATNAKSGTSNSDRHLAFLLQENARKDKAELDREEKRTDAHVKAVTSQATQFTDMVTKTTESAANRDREHMKGVNESQQAFFSNMMAQTGTMFQQTMAMMMMGHNQTMEAMKASHDRDMQQNSPAALMDVLMKGINIGKEFENDDDPLTKSLSAGGDMLTKLLELKKEMPQPAQPAQRVQRPNPGSAPNRSNSGKEPILTKAELRRMIELKNVLRSRGIDLEDQLEQASRHYRDIPEEELTSDGANQDNTQKGESDDTPNKETTET